eukprot:Clim_evm82s172 gene=Clim_evmTU82s172
MKSRASGINPQKLKQARASGVLNIANSGLTELPEEVFSLPELANQDSHIDFSSTDNGWWEKHDLHKLDVSRNQLQTLPENLHELESLVKLILRDNEIRLLPESLCKLPNLEVLILTRNKLCKLPEFLGLLVTLKVLQIDANELLELPISVGELVHMEQLYLQRNSLTTLPSSLGCCQALRTVDLSYNQLVSVPDVLFHLPELKDLKLSRNRIKEVPNIRSRTLVRLEIRECSLECIGDIDCPCLKELYLGSNKLAGFPPKLNAALLTTIDCGTNKISNIPNDIDKTLPNVERLDISNNGISEIPPAVVRLRQLESLVIEGNPLRSIRQGVIAKGTSAVIKYLKDRYAEEDADDQPQDVMNRMRNMALHEDYQKGALVNLAGKGLSAVPDEVHEAVKDLGVVKRLNLSNNKFVEVPTEVAQAGRHLEDLDLSINRLVRFPGDLCTCLSNLAHLDLSRNQMDLLPLEFSHLGQLLSLRLGYNKFRAIPALEGLNTLEVLILTDNQIASIDVHILLSVPKLKTLDLSNNNISQVPAELGHLRLQSLGLTGNPFRIPRPQIVMKGTNAILDYLRSRLPADNRITV